MVLLNFIFLFAFSTTLFAQKIDLSSGAKVEFDAVGKPAMINIKGTGSKATGVLSFKDGSADGEFVVNLKDFTTDMDMRDEHMKEKYLEVHKSDFGKAILKISQKVEALFPQSGVWNPQNLKGSLTLHGVTKEIPLNSKINIKDGSAKGAVNFKIKLKDFNIEIPEFAGITVADEVTANVLIDSKVSP
ncbi:MAG: YceI family protein [Bacteriovoracaceae bacterium]|nr:YceI family protein [Bacteriovoracaceae bacterium]